MRIGFIGAGKVGFTFGKYLVERNSTYVSGYYSRTLQSSKEAAQFTNTKYYESLGELVKASDTLILSVPDGSIEEVYNVLKEFDLSGKIICHCSGALSSHIFSDIRSRGAYAYSVHPIFAVSSKLTAYQELSKAYFTIEGDDTYLNQVADFIRGLGNPVQIITAKDKVKYHAASVFASNLVIGLYSEAVELLKSCNFQEEFAEHALLPLFQNNCENLVRFGKVAALTGPVERGDVDTIRRHLEALSNMENAELAKHEESKANITTSGETKMQEIYRLLSQTLVTIAKDKNPERDYRSLEKLFGKDVNKR